LISLPDVRIAEAGLKKAKFVVVQDISNKVETLKYADVVLPAASWIEKEGTMTNAERRISYLNKIVDAPGEAIPDAEIICRFAQKMGFAGFDFSNMGEIFAEHAALTAGTNVDISGLSYSIIREKKSVQWPYTKETNAGAGNAKNGYGTPRLFTDHKFFTPSQKAIIHSFPDNNTSEQPDADFPLILTTGRIRDQWHTMSKTGKVNKLKQHISESFLEIHPENARERGIAENMLVDIISRQGLVRVKAKYSTDIKRGVVFLPMHWGKILNNDLNRANNLTANVVDPKSKEPDFKFTAVQVQLYKKPIQKIIVIGAGAGACGFVKSYRALNESDPIEIFSKENFPFYNRVLLPDYISGALPWNNLVKMTDEEEQQYNIKLNRGVSIESIDRKNKTVTDNNGQIHSYDIDGHRQPGCNVAGCALFKRYFYHAQQDGC
jgi:ferredoxin-nitrate reductase